MPGKMISHLETLGMSADHVRDELYSCHSTMISPWSGQSRAGPEIEERGLPRSGVNRQG